MKVHLSKTKNWYLLENPSNKTVDFIKRHLTGRTSMRLEGGWHVSRIVDVINYALSNGEDVDYSILPDTIKAELKREVHSTSSATLHLTDGAPEFIVDAVWKAIAKRYHPDTYTGDADLFMKYKAAYDKIKASF